MLEDSASSRARLPPLRWALALVWRAAPGLATVSLALVLLQSLVPAAILLMVKEVVDSIASQATTGRGVLDEPLLLVGVIGLLGILGAALQAADAYTSQALGLRLTDRVQDLIHERSISLDLAYFEAADYHDHLHRAQRAGAHRPARVLDGLTALARSLFTALAVGSVLAMLEPWIVLGLATAAVPGLAVRLRHSRQLFRWWQRRSAVERLAMLYDSMITNLAFAKELRLLGLGSHLKRRHAELRDTVREERLDLARRRAVGDVATHAMAALVMFVCLVVIVLRVGRQAATVGELVVCYQALVLLLASARQILGAAASLYEDRLFIGHLREFLEQRPRIVDPAAPRALRLPLREGIAFDAVTFRYPGSDEPALEDVSIELRAGEITALVGENGAGKTTLVKLLCRLYDPDAGRVLLDGVDVRELRVEHLRRAIGVVFQDYARFPLSARENVAFGDVSRLEDATRLDDAARQAGAGEIVSHLALGYDTPLSKSFEGGHDLSDGQWQRLALARSYFKDASILALDEPTAALDALAETGLHARLRALARGRTTLLISHRFSTLSMADRIAVLERGRVAEQGTHEELVRRAGVYAKLHSAQARLYPTAPASGRER